MAVEFRSLLSLRQAHGFAFGKSDLFMLCACSVTAAAEAEAVDGRPTLVPCARVRCSCGSLSYACELNGRVAASSARPKRVTVSAADALLFEMPGPARCSPHGL